MTMRALCRSLALLAACGAVSAQESAGLPPALQAKVTLASQACADFEHGEFSLEAGAVVRTDLDGDLQPDWVLNEHYFACSSAASLFGSTGGSLSHFLVGDSIHSLLNQGWEMRTLGRNRVLLAEVHGTQCDAFGYTPCVTASVWDTDVNAWRTAAATWEQ